MSSPDDERPPVDVQAKEQAEGLFVFMSEHGHPIVARFAPQTKHVRKGPSGDWHCDVGHNIPQCICGLDEKYEQCMDSMHPRFHDEAVAFYIAYIDWFHKGTSDLDITGLLTKIKKHHDAAVRCLKDGIEYD
jgi:hypothetical protein